MAKKATTTKTPAKKAPAKKATPKKVEAKTEEKAVTVEVITPEAKKEAIKETPILERVEGSHKVKFKPNGNYPKLGLDVKEVAATTAQVLVDKGFGEIIDG